MSWFYHNDVKDVLWAETIFGKSAILERREVDKEPDVVLSRSIDGQIWIVIEGDSLRVERAAGDRLIDVSYFDFARILDVKSKDGLVEILVGAGGSTKFRFKFEMGMRRKLEIWATELMGSNDVLIFKGASGLETYM